MSSKYKRKKLTENLSDLSVNEEGLDEWQINVLKAEGDISIRAGRQVGKSTVIAKAAVNFALHHANVKVLVIAAAQRESSFIFEKMRGEIELCSYDILAEKPTMTKILLKNGSEIHSLPTGRTGYLIRGQTIDLLIGDEAAFIPELVWISVIPMIAVSRETRGFGWIWMLSTPWGNSGYFYDSFKNPKFKNFHIRSADCPRISKEILESERNRLSKQEYMQEWEGEFIEQIDKFFPTELLKSCMITQEKPIYSIGKKYFLGVDVARYGVDLNAFVVAELREDGTIWIIEAATTERKALTETKARIIQMNRSYSFNRIFIDDAGVGGGLTDELIAIFRGKVIGLNNARRIATEERKKRLLKEDLYSNTLVLMEQEKLKIISNLDLFRSLDMTRFEYSTENNLRIYGKNQHLAEAFVRACYGIKDKGLKLFCHSF